MFDGISVKLITQADLYKAGCFDVPNAIDVIENAFLQYRDGKVIFPDKVAQVFDQATQSRINCLPAAVNDIYGMKWVSVFPDNPQKYQLPNLSAVILLSRLDTGFPVAFMEGTLCSNLRTAAVGAVAAKYLAKKDSQVIGFIGAGEQAKSHFLTMMAVRPGIRECRIASRTAKSEQKFAEQMCRFYPEVNFVCCNGNYERAVSTADIIVTAISGQETVLKAAWIKDGAFYCHVAGLEDEFAVAQKASKIVVDDWEVVKHRTQTISQMYQQGLLTDDDIYANLIDIITGKKAARENENEFIYFNSVGLSFLDIALANSMYECVAEKGLGRDVLMQEKSMFEFECEEGIGQWTTRYL